MIRKNILLILAMAITGCSSYQHILTPAEQVSGNTYIPIDPFDVDIKPGLNCPTPPNPNTFFKNLFDGPDGPAKENAIAEAESKYSDAMIKYQNIVYGDDNSELLKLFPDNTMRSSIEEIDINGNILYGAAGVTSKENSYRITMDYVNSDTTNLQLRITKYAMEMGALPSAEAKPIRNIFSPLPKKYDPSTVTYEIKALSSKDLYGERDTKDDSTELNVPVYVGIGLRVTAYVKANDVKADISGLGVLGADAETKKIKGNLIIQTLGVNGAAIASALPIQSELNRTTVGSAMVAVGSIKALLYDEKTIIAPRIVGIYLPLNADRSLVNAIISILATRNAVQWEKSCQKPQIGQVAAAK